MYDLGDGAWEYRTILVPIQGSLEGEFGWSVAVDGDYAIVGAPWNEPDGYAELFDGMTSNCDCLADVTGDGTVNVSDILAVIAAWGTCEACATDINGDNFVDVSDLLTVISLWGDCP